VRVVMSDLKPAVERCDGARCREAIGS